MGSPGTGIACFEKAQNVQPVWGGAQIRGTVHQTRIPRQCLKETMFQPPRPGALSTPLPSSTVCSSKRRCGEWNSSSPPSSSSSSTHVCLGNQGHMQQMFTKSQGYVSLNKSGKPSLTHPWTPPGLVGEAAQEENACHVMFGKPTTPEGRVCREGASNWAHCLGVGEVSKALFSHPSQSLATKTSQPPTMKGWGRGMGTPLGKGAVNGVVQSNGQGYTWETRQPAKCLPAWEYKPCQQ